MTMQLYFNPQSRATIARWMLDECGVAYELVHVDFTKGEHKAPAYLAINPAGKLPTLVDGATRIYENAAICLYLGDRDRARNLAPALDAPERGRYLSLVVYATSQLEPSMGDALLKAPHHPSRGWSTYDATEDTLERELGDGPYLFGEWFTLADVLIGAMLIWRRRFSGGAAERPRLAAYVDRLLERPAARAVS